MTALRRIRLERRITIGDLAKRSGLSYHTVWRADRGETQLSEASAFALAPVLDADPAVLRGLSPTVPEAA